MGLAESYRFSGGEAFAWSSGLDSLYPGGAYCRRAFCDLLVMVKRLLCRNLASAPSQLLHTGLVNSIMYPCTRR